MNNRLLKISSLVVISLFFLPSCNKNTIDNTLHVDSYINAIYNNAGVPVYSVMHTAYSYSKLTSVSVKGSSGTINLTNVSNLGFSFYTPLDNATDSAKYTTAVPSADSFTYNGTFDTGEATVQNDVISGASVAPVAQLNPVKTVSDIQVSWQQTPNAQAYKVRIYSQNTNTIPYTNTLFFESDFLVPTDATTAPLLTFPLSNFTQYISGNMLFEVDAFIFESKQDTYEAVSATTVKRYFGN